MGLARSPRAALRHGSRGSSRLCPRRSPARGRSPRRRSTVDSARRAVPPPTSSRYRTPPHTSGARVSAAGVLTSPPLGVFASLPGGNRLAAIEQGRLRARQLARMITRVMHACPARGLGAVAAGTRCAGLPWRCSDERVVSESRALERVDGGLTVGVSGSGTADRRVGGERPTGRVLRYLAACHQYEHDRVDVPYRLSHPEHAES